MASREDLIQAKMAEIRAAEEEKKRKLFEASEEKKRKLFEAKIAAEALLRVETEKLIMAIECNDLAKLHELAGNKDPILSYRQPGSPCAIVKHNACKYLSEYNEKQAREEAQKKLEQARIAKEAELAAIPIERLIVGISELKKYCTQYGGSYIINSGLCSSSKFTMETQLKEQSAKLADYEAELARRTIDKATIDEIIQNAAFVAKVGCTIEEYNTLKQSADEAITIIMDQIAQYKAVQEKIGIWLNTMNPRCRGLNRHIVDKKEVQNEYEVLFEKELNAIGKKIVACYQETMAKMYIKGKPRNTLDFLPMLIKKMELAYGYKLGGHDGNSSNKIFKDNMLRFYYHLNIQHQRLSTASYSGKGGQPGSVPPSIPPLPWV